MTPSPPRPLVAIGDGPGAPTAPLRDGATVAGTDVRARSLLCGWVVEEAAWADVAGVDVLSLAAGYQLAGALTAGTASYLPTRWSAVPRLLATSLAPDVAVVTGRPSGGRFRFGPSVGWAHAAARRATQVVVHVNAALPPFDAPEIPGEIVAVVEHDTPPAVPSPSDLTPAERTIGTRVAGLVPTGATLQHGPGRIAAAVLAAIEEPVAVRSGVVTPDTATLHSRGLVRGRAEATYAWGAAALEGLIADDRLRLVPVEESHHVARLAAIDRFVAVNTAVQVGIDGSVNIERTGARLVAGLGGHPDFCSAAARSVGGTSIIALKSEHGGRSTIVPRVEVVSTPGCDVDVVVTEHGVADLRGRDDAARRRQLLAVCAPEHRDELARRTR